MVGRPQAAARRPARPGAGVLGRVSPARLTPGYFAGVMATGIVSIGAQLKGLSLLATALFWVAVVFYVSLVGLTAWRFVSFRREMSEDFHDPARAFGFFTFIAATNVLGAALVGVGQNLAAGVLVTVSLVVWLVLGYVVPWTAVLGSERRPMLDTANGTWFIWVVASQSIAVVAAPGSSRSCWRRASGATSCAGSRSSTNRPCGAWCSRSACMPWPASTSGGPTPCRSSSASAPAGSGGLLAWVLVGVGMARDVWGTLTRE